MAKNKPIPFDRAVRHLFRHLEDAAALRKNVLTAHLFSVAKAQGLGDEAAAAMIRKELVSAAQVSYAEMMAAGRRQEAHRTREIVSMLCDLRPANEIATHLALSLPQYYRDRRKACTDVARILVARCERGSISSVEVDLLGLQLRRAVNLIDEGFSTKAVDELEALRRHADSKEASILILAELSRATFDLGDIRGAQQACAAAKTALLQADRALGDGDTLRYRVGMVEFQIASVTQSAPDALSIIAPLAEEIGWTNYVARERDDLAIEVLAQTCHAAMLAGRIGQAQRAIQRAAAIAQGSAPSATIRSQINSMRAHSFEGGSDGAGYRMTLCLKALELARGGSPNATLMALLGLVDNCVALGYEDRAKAFAEQARTIAKSMEGPHVLAAVVDTVAPSLFRTNHWTFAKDLLDEVSTPASAYYAMRREAFMGQLALRNSDFEQAARNLAQANEKASAVASIRTKALVLPELALAQFNSGAFREAKFTAQAATEVLEACGSSSALRFGYDTVRKVLSK